MNKNPKIVIIGGGTGSYTVASGLSSTEAIVSMLMTMVDEGGSNRVIRDEFGLLPTSGIRQAIVALSKNKTVLRKLFTYRYHKGGEGIEGMTFGNLFMAAMADIMGSQKRGIEETCKLLQVKGKILPVSYDNVRLVAKYEDGTEVVGEHNIDVPHHKPGLRITNLETRPEAKIDEESKLAILESDLIILGPGDFYTNTVANLIVEGVVPALKESKGKLVFIANLMDSPSEAPNYMLSDFINDLKKYIPLELVDYVLVNNNLSFPKQALEAYDKENAHPIKDDLEDSTESGIKIIRADLLSRMIPEKVKGDSLGRSMIRHDPAKLSSAILSLID